MVFECFSEKLMIVVKLTLKTSLTVYWGPSKKGLPWKTSEGNLFSLRFQDFNVIHFQILLPLSGFLSLVLQIDFI
ncbi:unnamed protein product [Citrullus colocynthis]|uniref:Uncharacterized protein n=1 Tax=Citrullus colocynthis TaxID=252529 RepID=A0ABP0XW50_9ROSI